MKLLKLMQRDNHPIHINPAHLQTVTDCTEETATVVVGGIMMTVNHPRTEVLRLLLELTTEEGA